MKIKAGYRIEVSSWECDGDNGKTEVMEGLTKPEVKAVVEYLKLFTKSTSCGGFGNCYNASDDWECRFTEAVWHVYKQNIVGFNSLLDIENDDEYSPEDIQESIMDGIDYNLELTSEVFRTRLVSSITVTSIPQDVAFEDVTSEFI